MFPPIPFGQTWFVCQRSWLHPRKFPWKHHLSSNSRCWATTQSTDDRKRGLLGKKLCRTISKDEEGPPSTSPSHRISVAQTTLHWWPEVAREEQNPDGIGRRRRGPTRSELAGNTYRWINAFGRNPGPCSALGSAPLGLRFHPPSQEPRSQWMATFSLSSVFCTTWKWEIVIYSSLQ